MPPQQSGIDPEFTPHVAVQPAGPVAREVENPLNQLRRVFDAAGLLTSATVATLNQRAALNQLKEQSIARQEARMREAIAEGARVQRSLQARRIQAVRDEQLGLMVEGVDHDAEWLFRQTRLRFNNAASVEEQREWAEMLVQTKGLADRFADSEERRRKNEIIQQFSLARLTARNATVQMGSDLQTNVDLQRDLIGDGVGIHSRVQDWVLASAMRSAPDVFTIDPDDPDAAFKNVQREELVASLMAESLRIGDALVQQHGREIELASTQAGVDLLGASFVAYFEGDVPPEDLAASINDIGKLHFNHLTATEQTIKLKELAADGIQAAANGQFGQDVSTQVERIDALIDAAPYNEFERSALRQKAREDLTDLALGRYGSLVAEGQLSMTMEVPIIGTDGQIVRRSITHPDAGALMARSDPLTGRSRYDALADQAIIDAGVDGDPSEMTVFELSVAQSIRETARDLNDRGIRRIAKAVEAQNNFAGVLSGDPSADASDAYEVGLARRAFTNDQHLTAEQTREVQQLAASVRSQETASGLARETEPEAGQVWDGASRLERIPETRSLREAVWMIEAEMWNNPLTRSAHALPNNLTGEMKTMWAQGGPEEMLDVVYFASNLNEPRRDELFASFGHGTPEAVALRNALHNQLLAANNIEFKATTEDLAATARQQMTAVPAQGRQGFLNAPTAFPEHIGARNQDVAAAALAEVLGVQKLRGVKSVIKGTPLGNLISNASKDFNENVGNIAATFMGPSKPIVDRLFEQWSFRVQTTDDSPIEAANWVFEQMRAEGFRFTNLDGEVTIVRDPVGHFGPDTVDADDVNERIAEYIEQPLAPWQRIVIAEALGIERPVDIPITIGDMYRAVPELVSPDFFQTSRGEPVPIRFVISDGTNRDAQMVLRKDPFDFGGVTIQAITPDGRIAPVIRATRDVEYTDPDGRQHMLRRGEPLTVFTDFLFDIEPTPERVAEEAGFSPAFLP